MNKEESISFKYKNDSLYNIISFLFFLILLLLIYIIFKNVESIILKITLLLITYIVLNILHSIVNNKISIRNALFTLKNNTLIYENFSEEYSLPFNEIKSITKEIYYDDTKIIRSLNYLYKINIKDAGSFIFKYYDKSLDDAFNLLSSKINIKIDEI